MVLGKYFFTLSNVDMQFVEKKIGWKSYITSEILPTTKRVELINMREFAAPAIDENTKRFMVYVATLSTTSAM